MTAFTKFTKAQLLSHIATQDVQLVAAGREIESLRLQRAMAQPVGSANTPVRMPRFYVQGREVAPSAKQVAYYTSRNAGSAS
jgi:hypothetical protein